MRDRFLWLAMSAGAVPMVSATAARAQDSADAGASVAADADAVTAPSLKSHGDPVYPPEALRDRIEGSVGLEITLDETGAVVDARVTEPAGHGFDEAAVAAVRQWTFEPARKNGAPARATVHLALPFQLPASS